MKTLILLLCFPFLSFAQSGDSLWSALLTRYQGITNYVDQGQYERVIYGNTVSVAHYDYYVAMDSASNVSHWFAEAGGNHLKYQYVKKAGEEIGEFTRSLQKTETEPRTLFEACASLIGTGGGILLLPSRLMFPERFIPVRKPYDSLVVSRDTLIDSLLCHVIVEHSSHFQTQAMIDEMEWKIDSMSNPVFARLPDLPRPVRIPKEPGLTRFITKYYISKESGLIVRRANYIYDEDGLASESTLTMHPKVDMESFQKYLAKGFYRS